MNYIKLIIVNAFLFFILVSCKTTLKIIPGENKALINNIYTEYLTLADGFYSQQNYDKAIIYYKKAMDNKDLYWNSYYKLAKTYVFKSNWVEAEKMFVKLLERDKKNMSIKSSLAYVYAMNNNMEKSIELYKELLDEYPENEEVLENYIIINLKVENIEETNKNLQLLQEKFPENKNIEKINSKYIELEKKLNPEEETASDSSEEYVEESD